MDEGTSTKNRKQDDEGVCTTEGNKKQEAVITHDHPYPEGEREEEIFLQFNFKRTDNQI